MKAIFLAFTRRDRSNLEGVVTMPGHYRLRLRVSIDPYTGPIDTPFFSALISRFCLNRASFHLVELIVQFDLLAAL